MLAWVIQAVIQAVWCSGRGMVNVCVICGKEMQLAKIKVDKRRMYSTEAKKSNERDLIVRRRGQNTQV